MITVVFVAILLTGCKAATVNTNEQQLKLVSEYAAGLLLKYDKKSDSMLQYESIKPTKVPEEENRNETVQPTVEPTKVPEQTPNQSKHPNDTTKQPEDEKKKVTLTEIWNQEGIKVTYKGAVLQAEYPNHAKNNYVILKAEEGMKYCIVEFEFHNGLEKSTTISSQGNSIQYTLEHQKNSYHAKLTMLVNDIHFWNSKLDAGETKNAIAVFVVPDQINLSETVLKVTRGEEAATVVIK